MEFKRISIDTSKHIFTLHGVDEHDRVILRRELRRAQVEAFFTKVPPTEVALEACAGAHHWGRVLGAMGHRVKLIPPQYVKPFVKRSKNDRNDAEAISEAASRPSMRTVSVKTVDEQAAVIIVRQREMLVGQRTQSINALRGHAAEFGVIAAKGSSNVEILLCALSDHPAIPDMAKAMFEEMGKHVTDLDVNIRAIDQRLLEQHKASEISQRLAAIPGIGPITAITMALSVNPASFESGRHFAAWLGLTPREHSTGGKHRLGRISKAGNERLRQLLVVGAMAVLRFAKPGSKSASGWLLQLLERRPRKVAAVALANKVARVVWAMMARGEVYRRQPVAT
jgi:transposase